MKRTRRTRDVAAPSKTRLKQESRSLQELGEALTALTAEDIEALKLPGRLGDAIEDARRIRSHEALRRQRQFIGRLMREVDPEPIREFLSQRQVLHDADSRVFHTAESWRHRLLDGDAETLEQCATALKIDVADLREKLEAVSSAPSEAMRKGASRALFRYLHDALSAGSVGDAR
jgi:ribosome-associated protein